LEFNPIFDYEILEIKIKFKKYAIIFSVLNASTDSMNHHYENEKNGAFGFVFAVKHFDLKVAIKCLHYNKNNFAHIFMNALK
jgi:hypothetical protein